MKKAILIITLCFWVGCKQSTKSPNEAIKNKTHIQKENDLNAQIHFLKDFYDTVYGAENINEDVKRKYLSQKLLNRIDSLTSDPR